MTNETKPSRVKQQQRRNLALLAFAIVFMGWGLYKLLSNEGEALPKTASETNTASNASTSSNPFASPLDHVDSEKVWNERVENRLSEALKKGEETKSQLEATQTTQTTQLTQSQQQLDQLRQEVQALSQEVSNLKANPSVPAVTKAPSAENMTAEELNDQAIASPGQSIREDRLELAHDTLTKTPLRNPTNYVPSGTFVKAILLGGADAPASVTSQANPKPMVFRLVEQGTLPNHQHSHLKDCTVIAAVTGDISSERGEIRLETLSCVKPNGGIIDMPVQGTVFGRDGKSGVRGTPVWREGALIQRAAAAGTLSGVSDALSQRYTTSSISPLGSTQTVDNNQVLQYGAARGASTGMNKLADYYIQRAEQYHPVIQISAGDRVDVVFLKGFFLDDQSSDEKESDITKNSTLSPLPLTAKQVQRLKERQAELGLQTSEGN